MMKNIPFSEYVTTRSIFDCLLSFLR